MGKQTKPKACKSCGNPLSGKETICPMCGTENKISKPIYKKWWFWVVAVFIVVGVAASSNPKTELSDDKSNPVTSSDSDTTSSKTSEKTEKETSNDAPKENSVPTEYKSALKKAEMYSDMMHMSKAAIYDQLVSEYGEKFSEEAAQYAMENLVADWNANALAKAKDYQDMMSMSPDAIYDQLVSEYGEKFTAEEAQYAVDNLN